MPMDTCIHRARAIYWKAEYLDRQPCFAPIPVQLISVALKENNTPMLPADHLDATDCKDPKQTKKRQTTRQQYRI